MYKFCLVLVSVLILSFVPTPIPAESLRPGQVFQVETEFSEMNGGQADRKKAGG